MNFFFDFNLPTKIIFGCGTFIKRLGSESIKLGKRTAIITGKYSSKKNGILSNATNILNREKIEFVIFDQVESNPNIKTIHNGAEFIKKTNVDFLIAIGGGSSIDAAKAIGIILCQGGKISDYFGVEKVLEPILPIIAIPTTSGTGAEVTKYSNINDNEKKTKNLINSLNICPEVALIDPDLCLTMPPELTATSGIDALTHVIESYVCTYSQPLTEMINLEAIKILNDYLPTAVNLQRDQVAHLMISYASLLGGIAINNAGTGIAHGLSFSLTAKYNIPHGVATGLLLPYVMEFNIPSNLSKFSKIAENMGENVKELSKLKAAEMSVKAVKNLLRLVNFPETLNIFGVQEKEIEIFAKELMANPQKLANNPRMPSLNDIIRICMDAKDKGIKE